MRSLAIRTFVWAMLAALLPGLAMAETTYLEATFDDKAIDQPIGTGGAAAGEPVDIDAGLVTAVVRGGPTPTPCLEIQDVTDYGAGAVSFEFLGSQEFTTGFLSIAADLWFHQIGPGHATILDVREQGSAACGFASFYFLEDGQVLSMDDEGHTEVIGVYVTGKVFPVVLNFDMEAGTYDVWLDGLQVVFARPHEITGCGVGSVLIGTDHDSDLDGKISVDRVKVTDYHQEVGAERTSWGMIRALYR